MYATARGSESGGVFIAASRGSHITHPAIDISTEMSKKNVALVPTTCFASRMSFAPMH